MEGVLCGFKDQNLKFLPVLNEVEDGPSLSSFLDELSLRPKGLVGVEVRIYPVELMSDFGLRYPVTLTTEFSPQCENEIESQLTVSLKHLQGVTPLDVQQWQRLVHEILPSLR
jgi:hypothetical protein